MLGELCANGAGSDGGCTTGEALPVSLDLLLAGNDTTNANPDIPDDAVTLGGVPWLNGEVPSGACSGLGLPEVSLSEGQQPIQIQLPETAREAVDAPREELRVSHFASLGELTRPFSEILPGDANTRVSVNWKPPKTAAANGEVVRFWIVVRDLRGGSDFTERALCLLP